MFHDYVSTPNKNNVRNTFFTSQMSRQAHSDDVERQRNEIIVRRSYLPEPNNIVSSRFRSEIAELPAEFNIDGTPMTISVQMLRDNGVNPFGTLAAFFRERIRARAFQAGVDPNSIRGFLSAVNETNGSYHTHDDLIRIYGLTAEHLADVMVLIQESNMEVDITDVVWEFQIFREHRAGEKTRIPAFWKDVKTRVLWNTPDNINCMLYSLTFLRDGMTKRFLNRPQQHINESLRMMGILNWEKMEPLSKLKEVLHLTQFKDKQIIVVNGVSTLRKPVPDHHIFTGHDFFPTYKLDADGNPTNKQTDKDMLYLYYDMEKNHVAGIMYMPTFVRNKFGASAMWCHNCLYYVVSTLTEHDCDGPDERKIKSQQKKDNEAFKKNLKPCKECGEIGEHQCPFLTCQSCSSQFKRSFRFAHSRFR